MLLCHARCVLSRLHCNGHSLLLGFYLCRIRRIKNPSCSACGHSSQDISHLILHCPATDSLRRSLFGDSLSLYDLWSRPWGVARLLGLHAPYARKGSGNQQQQKEGKVHLCILDVPIWSRYSTAMTRPASPGRITGAYKTGEDRNTIWMNVGAHQKEKKNKKARQAGEQKKETQTTN